MVSWLIGVGDIGDETDFAKIRQYGFVYVFKLGSGNNPVATEIKNNLNEVLFKTFQRITLPEWPQQFATQDVYTLRIEQPVVTGIGEQFTVEYLSVFKKVGADTAYNFVVNSLLKWKYYLDTSIEKGWMPYTIDPRERTAVIGYVLLSPDLSEIWGGEIFGGCNLTEIDTGHRYTAGQVELAVARATFEFTERIPLLTAIRGQLRDTLFDPDIDYLEDIQRVIEKAKSIFTFADQG
jgi:hypothetical protein